MATRKRQKKRATHPADPLYRAVGSYVKKYGGSVVVAGPVQLMRWPGDAKAKFSIVVQCLGRAPTKEPS